MFGGFFLELHKYDGKLRVKWMCWVERWVYRFKSD